MEAETKMSETANGIRENGAEPTAKPPVQDSDLKALVKRANNGDKSCLSQVRALFADGPRGKALREANGSPVERLRRSLVEKAAGENVLIKEAMEQEIVELEAELAGASPTRIEQLLAERASICGFILNRYEDGYARSDGWPIHAVDLQMRKIDKAHARFLSALRTLAQVRKLALPTLQVNIARNQVNVAETRP